MCARPSSCQTAPTNNKPSNELRQQRVPLKATRGVYAFCSSDFGFGVKACVGAFKYTVVVQKKLRYRELERLLLPRNININKILYADFDIQRLTHPQFFFNMIHPQLYFSSSDGWGKINEKIPTLDTHRSWPPSCPQGCAL